MTPDPHLSDLLRLREIANGTPSEAYTWPALVRALAEMIRRREAQLAGVGGRVVELTAEMVAAVEEVRRENHENND